MNESKLIAVVLEREIKNPLVATPSLEGSEFFAKFIPILITIALVIAAVVFLFVMILGGISWMAAGGDKTQIESARGRVTNALVGLFIVFTVFALLKIVEGLLGISLTTIDLGALRIQ